MSGLFGHRKERMAAWAWRDPSLRPLPAGLRKRFVEIVGPRREPVQPAPSRLSGLGALNVIGPLSSEAACDYVRRLAEKYGTRSSLCWYVSDLQEKKTL